MCCDSLSNLYLWHIKYSNIFADTDITAVVIRFQICIFDILNTAYDDTLKTYIKLWFAFKFVSLTYEIQPSSLVKTLGLCCDSLSNLYLWHIKYSCCLFKEAERLVVIRFQICIFDILNTANLATQLPKVRCDSLSNLYLWHIKYSISILNWKP